MQENVIRFGLCSQDYYVEYEQQADQVQGERERAKSPDECHEVNMRRPFMQCNHIH